MRAGLAADIDATRFCLAQRPQFVLRRDMQDMDARTGPFRQNGGAADRFDGDHGGPGGDMGKPVSASGGFELELTPRHDRGRFRMERDTVAVLGHVFEALQHGAGGRRGQIAEGIAHETLEADDAAGDQVGQVFEVLFRQEPVDSEIDMRLFGGEFVLLAQGFGGACRRVDVGHLEHGGHPAHRCGGRAGAPVFLVGVAGLPEMDMGIDGAGQHVHAGGIQRFGCGRHCARVADSKDFAVPDRDACVHFGIGKHQCAARDDQICCCRHVFSPFRDIKGMPSRHRRQYLRR